MEDKNIVSSESCDTEPTFLNLSQSAKPLESQVAGHSFDEKCFTIGEYWSKLSRPGGG